MTGDVPEVTAAQVVQLVTHPSRTKPLVLLSVDARISHRYPVPPETVQQVVRDSGVVARLGSVIEARELSRLLPSVATYGGAIRVIVDGAGRDAVVRTDTMPAEVVLRYVREAVLDQGVAPVSTCSTERQRPTVEALASQVASLQQQVETLQGEIAALARVRGASGPLP